MNFGWTSMVLNFNASWISNVDCQICDISSQISTSDKNVFETHDKHINSMLLKAKSSLDVKHRMSYSLVFNIPRLMHLIPGPIFLSAPHSKAMCTDEQLVSE